MSILHPHHDYRRIYEIPVEFFREQGIKLLLIDVDNTLTTDNNPVPHADVLAWLDACRDAGLRLLAFSNNHEPRVAPFAKGLGLEYVADAHKPLPGRVRKFLAEVGILKEQTAIIGDQIFTDILCGRLVGCMAILVEPMAPEKVWHFRLKRWLEVRILRGYRRKHPGAGD